VVAGLGLAGRVAARFSTSVVTHRMLDPLLGLQWCLARDLSGRGGGPAAARPTMLA
jgi:hypothetical protein